MSTFLLHLQDATRSERIGDIVSFVGEDSSGSFGLLAGHARFMTTLVFGLARFRTANGTWEFLALPGALVYFVDNELFLSTRRYVRDTDYERISAVLAQQLVTEEERLHDIRESLHRMEQEMLKRLWQIGRGEVYGP